ncbi:L-histidine N(alpha)-methyltransferase [Streptomyces sp. NPDC048057]|uniref:L-histidine N(alpha)-methyltransferase n=1 Tax=Streptomyces sp. NPDC048057 TaxID=3155628 RepID=UPI0033F861D7
MSQATFDVVAVESEENLWTDSTLLSRTLFRPQPRIPEYYGYDDRGSRLFEDVTRLPQYYPTRVEQALLDVVAPEIAETVAGGPLVELGSGSAKKTGVLLRACAKYADPHFVPLDVSASMMRHSFETLSQTVPGLRVTGVVGRYERTLTALSRKDFGRRCVTALGSNIGNMLPEERLELLALICGELRAGEYFFVTADLTKSKSMLEHAYNDPPTDRTHTDFRLNRLIHLNRLYGASFPLERFHEFARYDVEHARIEVHLHSPEPQTIDLGSLNAQLSLAAGDTIVVDYSCKFEIDALCAEVGALGCELLRTWTDPRYRYGAFFFRKR